MYALKDTSQKVCCCKERAASWTWDVDSRGSEGLGSGSLVSGDHPFSSVQNRKPECSPTHFHSREVNAEDVYGSSALRVDTTD